MSATTLLQNKLWSFFAGRRHRRRSLCVYQSMLLRAQHVMYGFPMRDLLTVLALVQKQVLSTTAEVADAWGTAPPPSPEQVHTVRLGC